jgi:hypothetical protein
MADDPKRKLTSAEAEQVLARAASLDAEGVASGELSAEEIRQSALAAGISPHAVERALREHRAPAAQVSAGGGTFMGLPAVARASTVVPGAPGRTEKEMAIRLRGALGPDWMISDELGALRASLGKTTVTIVPGPQISVSVVSDRSDEIAVTAIAAGAGGVLGGLFTTLAMGLGSNTLAVVAALPIGGALAYALWNSFWKKRLAQRARETQSYAEAVSAALSEP